MPGEQGSHPIQQLAPIVAQETSYSVSGVGANETRTVLCDATGRLVVVAPAAGIGVDIQFVDGNPVQSDGAGTMNVAVQGVEGDDTTLTPVPAARFSPVDSEGGSQAVTNVSARIGPLTVNKAIQFFCDEICWCAKGNNTVVATNNDTPIQAGVVYEYVPTAGNDYLAFIHDANDGDLKYGRAEA